MEMWVSSCHEIILFPRPRESRTAHLNILSCANSRFHTELPPPLLTCVLQVCLLCSSHGKETSLSFCQFVKRGDSGSILFKSDGRLGLPFAQVSQFSSLFPLTSHSQLYPPLMDSCKKNKFMENTLMS